tara:strand:- start:24 stop:230 length:207 start_codon:yes stop_codon:yes gene_type:complete
MKWPPSKCWTSSKSFNGNRHFLLNNYGGKKDKRWVELIATKDKKNIIRVPWSELKLNWKSNWQQLPED